MTSGPVWQGLKHTDELVDSGGCQGGSQVLIRVLAVVAAVTALLGGAYAAAGLVLLPAWIAEQAPRFVAEKFGRELRVHHVGFDPFGLVLEVQGIDLREADGRRIASLSSLSVDVALRPLLDREVDRKSVV